MVFSDTNHDHIFKKVDEMVDVNLYKDIVRNMFDSSITKDNSKQTNHLTISQIIQSCHRNESLYKTVELSTIFDFDTLLDGIDIKNKNGINLMYQNVSIVNIINCNYFFFFFFINSNTRILWNNETHKKFV